MFFFYVIFGLSIILALISIFTTIQVHINMKIEMPQKEGRNVNNEYEITVKLYAFEKINYLKLDITKDQLERKLVQKNIQKMKKKIEKNKDKFDIKLISKIKKVNMKVQKINLKVNLGIEDAALNAIIVGILSGVTGTIIGILSKKGILSIENSKNQIYWKITPIYQNKNLLNIDLNSIISFKLIHIISAI